MNPEYLMYGMFAVVVILVLRRLIRGERQSRYHKPPSPNEQLWRHNKDKDKDNWK